MPGPTTTGYSCPILLRWQLRPPLAPGSSGVSKCQGWARDPSPSDPHPLFSDTKPSNSLIPFLSFRSSEVRTWCGGWLGSSPSERHRDLDFAPKPQKDCAKDPGISGEAPRPGVEPELRPEGRRSLRMGVRTSGKPAVGGPSAYALLTCSPALPAGCVPQSTCGYHGPCRKSSCKGWCLAGWNGVGHQAILLGFQGPSWSLPASWPADHVVGGSGGDEFACCHRFTGAQSSRCHPACSLVLPATSGPWEDGVRHE